MRSFSLSALALLIFLGASPSVYADEVETVPNAKRIVAVGGSITEIVYELGEQQRLIARDSTSLYPQEVLTLPDIGYMRQLPAEGVMSVDPDAILLLDGSGPPDAIEVLKKASVPLVSIPDRFSREGIVEKVRAVGHALGVGAKADALAARLDADIASAEKTAAEAKEKKRVLFILSAPGGKIMASGEGTAAGGIIAMAGAENVMSAFKGYKQVTDEAIITSAPDVILMMDRGDHGASDEQLLSQPALAETPAGKAKKVIRMEGTYLIGFGPRTAAAVRDLTTALAKP
jgi:iron complex transport system substrate-binding protein